MTLAEFHQLLERHLDLAQKIPLQLKGFSANILSRANSYVSQISYGDMKFIPEAQLLDGTVWQIRLYGSSPYTVEFYPSTQRLDCTCPHAAEGYHCKHGAALLKYLKKHYDIISSKAAKVEVIDDDTPNEIQDTPLNRIIHGLAKDLEEYALCSLAKQNRISVAGGHKKILARILNTNFSFGAQADFGYTTYNNLFDKYGIPKNDYYKALDVLKAYYVEGKSVIQSYVEQFQLQESQQLLEKLKTTHKKLQLNPIAENPKLQLKIALEWVDDRLECKPVQFDHRNHFKRELESSAARTFGYNPPKYISELDLYLCELVFDSLYKSAYVPWTQVFKHACPLQKIVNANHEELILQQGIWDINPIWAENKGTLELQVQLIAAGEQYLLNKDWFYLAGLPNYMVDPVHGIFRLDEEISLEYIRSLHKPLKIQEKQLELLKKDILSTAAQGFTLPDSLQPPMVSKAMTPVLDIHYNQSERILCYVSFFEYEDVGQIKKASVAQYFTDEKGELYQLERNLTQEQEYSSQLMDWVIQLDDADLIASESTADAQSQRKFVFDLLPMLVNQGWKIIKTQDLDTLRTRKGKLNLNLSSGMDWFELNPNIEYENEVYSIRELITQSNQGHTQVLLKDGSLGEIDSKLLKQFEFIYKLSETRDNALKLSKWHASLLNDMSDADLSLEQNVQWQANLKNWSSQQPEVVKVPKNLKAKLRPYQKEGLEWLLHLRKHQMGGILADDMGLGKTVQVISLLCELSTQVPLEKPTLIVAPASIAGNWASEIQKFAPHFTPIILHGTGREELKTDKNNVIYITTYGTLVREMEWIENIVFSLAVLDESQAIRNHNTLIFKACKMIQAEQRLCLTGTPIENNLMDLWSQFSYLNPGLLGSASFFAKNLAKPVSDGVEGVLPKLKGITQAFWLRRTKELVAKDLPDRENISLLVELDSKQQKLYDKHLKDYRSELIDGIEKDGLTQENRFSVLAALLRLRQIACAPELVGLKGISTKMDILVDMLKEDIGEKHKILVFSSFTSFLDIAEKRFQKEQISYLRIDGSTPAKTRTNLVKQFQETTDERVFLISLKAGGAGLNLTAADYVFIMDPWWNPASEEQAAARSHRIGQSNKVTVYRMIAKDTIEEKIISLSSKKAKLAKDVFEKDENSGMNLTAELIQELLS